MPPPPPPRRGHHHRHHDHHGRRAPSPGGHPAGGIERAAHLVEFGTGRSTFGFFMWSSSFRTSRSLLRLGSCRRGLRGTPLQRRTRCRRTAGGRHRSATAEPRGPEGCHQQVGVVATILIVRGVPPCRSRMPRGRRDRRRVREGGTTSVGCSAAVLLTLASATSAIA